MAITTRMLLAVLGATLASGLATLLAPAAHAQAGKTFTMKLATATINDTQHEWLKRFAATVEKNSGGRIKTEVYPASQLGSIPRMIEGVQLGSIQAWMGPPEFLVGVDLRYEALSAPGLFTSQQQAVRVLADPQIQKLLFELGEAKGLEGIGLAPIGPSSIAMRKEVRTLADLKGSKIRVLASPFQLELIRRMDASPVAMTLADVLPGLQQGTVDGALAVITVFAPFQYQEAAKYVIENDQPYVNSITMISKRWMAALPPDLQQVVRDGAAAVSKEIGPFVLDFFVKQTEIWKSKGGVIIVPPAAEKAAMLAKISTIGNDLSKDKPDLNKAVKLVFEVAGRYK